MTADADLAVYLGIDCLQVSVMSYFGAVVFFVVLMGWCIWHKIVNNPFTAVFERQRIAG